MTAKKEPTMTRQALKTGGKMALMPALLAAFGAYMNYRTETVRARAEAGYATMAPALQELQAQVKALSEQMAVQKELLAGAGVAPNARSAEVQHAAAERMTLVQKLKEMPKAAPRHLDVPNSLDAAFKMNAAKK